MITKIGPSEIYRHTPSVSDDVDYSLSTKIWVQIDEWVSDRSYRHPLIVALELWP